METTYQIAEVARRTGFTPSALRYYEDIGLLPVPARTEAGYRLYDDDAVTRLRFIARAKDLGCSLDEITDLVQAWDGDRCAPVSEKLTALIDAKLTETAARVRELHALANELRRAARSLASTQASDRPCDDTCACMQTEAVPIACSLDVGAMPRRLDDWQRVLTSVATREAIDGGLRLTFRPDVDVAELARLVGAEQDCCQFFSFALTVDTRGIALEVRAPEAAQDIVASLFAGAT